MKSEAEIRKHIRDIETIIARPCPEKPGDRCDDCLVLDSFNQVAVKALRWVLDQNPDADRHAESIAAVAQRLRMEGVR